MLVSILSDFSRSQAVPSIFVMTKMCLPFPDESVHTTLHGSFRVFACGYVEAGREIYMSGHVLHIYRCEDRHVGDVSSKTKNGKICSADNSGALFRNWRLPIAFTPTPNHVLRDAA